MTREVNHTPAPWRYDVESEAVFHDDGDVCPNIAFLSGNADHDERNLIDGTLMAAAPDLLAFAKEVRSRCIAAGIPGHELAALADAAIAKATAA